MMLMLGSASGLSSGLAGAIVFERPFPPYLVDGVIMVKPCPCCDILDLKRLLGVADGRLADTKSVG